jgi:hypothetical protein
MTQHQKIEKHITGLIWVFEFIRLLNLEVSNSSNQFSKAFLITQKDKIGPQQLPLQSCAYGIKPHHQTFKT